MNRSRLIPRRAWLLRACRALAILALPRAAQAQAPDTLARPDSTLVRALERARQERWFVRVSLADGSSVAGRVRATPDSMVYLVGAQRRIDAIVRLEHRERGGGGLVPFAVAGGVATGVLGYGVGQGLCEQHCRWTSGLYAGACSSLLGAGLGAFVGSVLFPGETKWVNLWPPGH